MTDPTRLPAGGDDDRPEGPIPPGRGIAVSISEFRQLLSLAAPTVVVQLGLMAMGVADTIMVGRVSAEALAAVALGNLYFMTVAIVGMGILMSLDPVVAQAVGARDPVATARGAQRGVVLALGMTPPTLVVLLGAGPLFQITGQPDDVWPTAVAYIHACMPGVPAFFLFVALRQTLQAHGRLAPIVVTIALANVLNVGLCWVLIYGKLGVPALGAVGTGWATTIARYAMLAMLYALARSTVLPLLKPFRRESLELRPLARMAAIGLPIGLAFLLEVAIFSLVGLLMGRMGTIPLAGHQVALNLASLTFMVPLGVGVAAAALVGRAVGRRDPAGVRRAARLSLICGATFMALSALMLLTFPRALAGLYSNDPAVIAVAAMLLPLAGFFQVFDGLQVVASGILRGIGDTRAPMIVTMIGYWVIGLPVSMLLGYRLGLGPQGLWWGFVAGLATVALFLVLRVRSRVQHIIAPVVIDDDRGDPDPPGGHGRGRADQGVVDPESTMVRRTNAEPSASSR